MTDPSLRIKSFAIIKLCGVSTKLKTYIVVHHENLQRTFKNFFIRLMFHLFFKISSYDLARRRLSLPISTLSTVEHTWNNRNIMFDDSDDTDNVSLGTPVEVSQPRMHALLRDTKLIFLRGNYIES